MTPVQCGCGERFDDTESFVEHYEAKHQFVPAPETYGHAEAEYERRAHNPNEKGRCVVCQKSLMVERYDDRFCSQACGWASVFGGKIRAARAERLA